jgi:uncharacterized protein YukE
MKFAIAALALTGAAYGSSILERQVQTIVGVVNDIEKKTTALDTAIKGFSGDIASLTAASDDLTSTVTKGVSTVNGASSITLTDSVQIQGQVSNLQTAVESVVNDLISKKDALVSAGQGGTIEKQLTDQLTGAKALQTAISSKVPPEVQSLAQQLSAGINTSLEKGISAFKGTGGSGAGSSSGSSSGGSSSSSGSSSSGSSSSGSSSSGSGSSSSHGAATTSAAPKPATFTGAASKTVAGSFAGVVAICVAIFAL